MTSYFFISLGGYSFTTEGTSGICIIVLIAYTLIHNIHYSVLCYRQRGDGEGRSRRGLRVNKWYVVVSSSWLSCKDLSPNAGFSLSGHVS